MEIEANLNEMLLEIGVRDMEKHGILCLVLRTRRPHITLQSIQHCSHDFFPLKLKKKIKKQGSDLLILPGCGRRLETNDTNKNECNNNETHTATSATSALAGDRKKKTERSTLNSQT
jgi:hypothetical protein